MQGTEFILRLSTVLKKSSDKKIEVSALIEKNSGENHTKRVKLQAKLIWWLYG